MITQLLLIVDLLELGRLHSLSRQTNLSLHPLGSWARPFYKPFASNNITCYKQSESTNV